MVMLTDGLPLALRLLLRLALVTAAAAVAA
jgi:hypothetical protein